MAFSPFRSGQDPLHRSLPSREQIDADLQLRADARVRAVRFIFLARQPGTHSELAARHKMLVSVGAWLDRARDTNQAEIHGGGSIFANRHSNVIRVSPATRRFCEAISRSRKLGVELERVRALPSTNQCSTAEPWHIWVDHPELAEHVDFIGVHLLPYWEGIAVDKAIDFLPRASTF